jgi:hypothetical protein
MTCFKDQRGIAHVLPLVAVVIIAVIGLAGWRVYESRDNKPETNNSVVTQDNNEQSNDKKTESKTYTDEVGKFSLQYPADWSITTEKGSQGPNAPVTTTEITSPNGTVLHVSTNYGGRGGICEPGPTDVPHALRNLCATREYLSKEQIAEKTNYSSNSQRNEIPLYLVTVKYTNTTAHEYYIGLESEANFEIITNKPSMGALRGQGDFPANHAGFEGNIEMYAKGDSATFLSGNEGKLVKEIIRTFKFTD